MGSPTQQKTLSSRVQWSSVLPKFLKSRKTFSTFNSIQQYMWRHWHISKAAVDFDPSNNCVIWDIVCSTGHLCSLTVTVCTLYTVPSACLGLLHSSSLETSAGSSSTLPPDIWFGGCCDHNINLHSVYWHWAGGLQCRVWEGTQGCFGHQGWTARPGLGWRWQRWDQRQRMGIKIGKWIWGKHDSETIACKSKVG